MSLGKALERRKCDIDQVTEREKERKREAERERDRPYHVQSVFRAAGIKEGGSKGRLHPPSRQAQGIVEGGATPGVPHLIWAEPEGGCRGEWSVEERE